MNYGQIIHRVYDDSYVITKNGLPFHVYPYAEEFADEWDSVFAYADEHPECVTEEQPYTPPVITLEEAKTHKLREINNAADKAISELTITYPNREIATFDKQESEARAYAADPTSHTPLLSALAEARGITLDDLVKRVLVKADAFAVASGHIIGTRQALEDHLDACTTIEEVKAITVTVDLPG